MMVGTSTGTGWALWFCHMCRWTGVLRAGEPHICNFKPSDTPATGPTTSPDTPQGPGPNNKEIA